MSPSPGTWPSGTRLRRAAAALALGLVVAGCGPGDARGPAFAWEPGLAERVVLIGLDGANWEVLDLLMEDDRVPLLESLVAAGSSAVLWSEEPTSTPAIWTTIFTGRGREAHGIEGFTARDAGSGRAVPVRSSMRRVPALWDYLAAFDRRVGVAGAHVTWPAEPVPGFVISRRVSEAGLPATTHPPELAERAGDGRPAAFEAAYVASGIVSRDAERFRHDWMRRIWIDDVTAFDLALDALEGEAGVPDLVFVYFHLPDVAQHNFWPDAATDREAKRRGLEPIFRSYEYVDGRLAELVERVGQEGTAFVVVSDHGHGSKDSGAMVLFERHTDRLLEALGYLRFGPDGEIDRRASRMLPGSETGSMVQLWVNTDNPDLATRESRERVVKGCVAALRGLRFDGSGRRLFVKVGRSRDDPDVVIGRIGVRDSDARETVTIGGRPIAVQDLYAPVPFFGTHTDRGVLIAAGPPFAAGRPRPPEPSPPPRRRPAGAAGVRDVAPTVLAVLGLPVPDTMDGRVVEEVLAPAFRSGRRFEPEPVALDWSPHRPEGLDGEFSDTMVEMLRALGYAR